MLEKITKESNRNDTIKNLNLSYEMLHKNNTRKQEVEMRSDRSI